MKTVQDAEFGEIIVRLHSNARRIALSIAPDGRLKISAPKATPMLAIKALIKTSRPTIRKLVNSHRNSRIYNTSQPIGKSHTLVIQHSSGTTTIKTVGTKILVNLSAGDNIDDNTLQEKVRQNIIKALRKEAKSYLPRRIEFMANKFGYSYEKVRLTHTSSRWGSCSSRGTISLNIALMQLSFELIDYVLAHELAHTKQMNHSSKFWNEVAKIQPNYQLHKKEIKSFSPNI